MAGFNYECDGQISIFDILPTDKPDTDKIIKEILMQVINSGTRFENKKKRVYELYQSDMQSKERAKGIKDAYGVGGGSLHGEYFQHGFQNSDSRGIEITYEEERKVFPWTEVEKIIHRIVDSGRYYQNPKMILTCVDGLLGTNEVVVAPQKIRDLYKVTDEQEVYCCEVKGVNNRIAVFIECKATEDRIPKGSAFCYYKGHGKMFAQNFTNIEIETDYRLDLEP